MELIKNTKIDFIGKRYYAFVFSAALALTGIVAATLIPLGKANLGIDFTGGVAIQLKFEKPFALERARKVLDGADFKDAELQEFASGNQLLIRLKNTEGVLKTTSDKLTEVFAKGFADNKFIVESTTAVGPTVGKKLQKDALWAVSISLLGILIYVAWRFELIFGIAAVIATFHDVLAVLGIFYLLNREINLLIITALLTLAGYSLTDTVVVFDRIRENLRKRGREALEDLINRSINEVLSRTIVTSSTVLIVLLALLIAGGEVIHDFSLALFLGVLVGTYSSIFVASPLLLLWKGKRGRLIR
ncbi:MAG: protein translocase subunit SecF [Deltaproteobacteria bacterium]|nr:protein translocase subunit SecF [Deltaproteobacteria bacterium]